MCDYWDWFFHHADELVHASPAQLFTFSRESPPVEYLRIIISIVSDPLAELFQGVHRPALIACFGLITDQDLTIFLTDSNHFFKDTLNIDIDSADRIRFHHVIKCGVWIGDLVETRSKELR